MFGDSYFDLPVGRSAFIACPLPKGWTPEHGQVLWVRVLFDATDLWMCPTVGDNWDGCCFGLDQGGRAYVNKEDDR